MKHTHAHIDILKYTVFTIYLVTAKYDMLQEEQERCLKEGEYIEEMHMITGPPRHYGTHYSNPQVWNV